MLKIKMQAFPVFQVSEQCPSRIQASTMMITFLSILKHQVKYFCY